MMNILSNCNDREARNDKLKWKFYFVEREQFFENIYLQIRSFLIITIP